MYEQLEHVVQHQQRRRERVHWPSLRTTVFIAIVIGIALAVIVGAVHTPALGRLRDSAISVLETSAFLLSLLAVAMILAWLSTSNPHLQIMPFVTATGRSDDLGTAISFSLAAHLATIAEIHSKTIPGTEAENVTIIVPDSPGSTQLQDIIATAITVGAGTTRVSVGRVFLMLKDIWPVGPPDPVLTGSIYGDEVNLRLTAHMKARESRAWEVQSEASTPVALPDLIDGLAYQIATDISRDSINASTWQGFRDLTKARGKVQEYLNFQRQNDLDAALMHCRSATASENSHPMLSDLLNKIGSLYAAKDNYQSSLIAYQMASRLETTDARRSTSTLGVAHALIGLHRYGAALTTYERVISNGSDLARAIAYDYSGVALTQLDMYREASGSFERALQLYQSCVENEGSDQDRRKSMESSVKLVYGSLALCYRILNQPAEYESSLRKCQEAPGAVSTYNQAGLELVSGNRKRAFELLEEVFIDQGPAPADYMLHDNHLATIRWTPYFWLLLWRYAHAYGLSLLLRYALHRGLEVSIRRATRRFK